MKKLGTPNERMLARISFLIVKCESGEPGTLLEIAFTSLISSTTKRSSSVTGEGGLPLDVRSASELMALIDTQAKHCAHELKLFQFTLKLV